MSLSLSSGRACADPMAHAGYNDGLTGSKSSARLGDRTRSRRLPFHVLAIQADEVDRVQHQGREAAVTDGAGDDLAREREQQPRALDHDERVQVFLRDV